MQMVARVSEDKNAGFFAIQATDIRSICQNCLIDARKTWADGNCVDEASWCADWGMVSW